MFIKINETILTATLEDNSSAKALAQLLENGPLTIKMSDYANFEKVGAINTTLPRNDKHFTTKAGDLILYLGNYFVIYYDTNTYTFTKLGKIDNISQNELKSILGKGDVIVTLSNTK